MDANSSLTAGDLKMFYVNLSVRFNVHIQSKLL